VIKIDGRARDLTDMKFGKLTALIPIARNSRTIIWECICECGRKKEAQSQHLLSGGTRSCGCLNGNQKQPGASKHPLYPTWKNMMARCYNQNATGYHRYGKRGIGVCLKWKNNFYAFVKDMGSRPVNFSVDRINPDGPYSPTNCRWASAKLQRANYSKHI